MLFKTPTMLSELDDAALVTASARGDREAFAEIVCRYQSLICSITYNATGSLAESEDLAQETFLVGWRQLTNLREPHKIRSWLCGIARNLVANAVRRNAHQPIHRAEPLEEATEIASDYKPAVESVIREEEEAILWRSLERIPETYREPLILFYREGESIERVAQQLELSEDTVKQRLSRGRKMLADEVTVFVEGALKQSVPGRAFTAGVLASLPVFATSASAATLGAGAVKGSTVATTATFLTWFTALLGPLIGLLGGYIGVRASLNATRTPRERECIVRSTKKMVTGIVLFGVVLFSYIYVAERFWRQYPLVFGLAGVLLCLVYVAWILVSAVRTNNEFRKIRSEEQRLHPEAFESELLQPNAAREYTSKHRILGLPLMHVCNGVKVNGKAKPAIGWIAFGEKAYGILFASGGFAVGGIAMGGACIGVVAFGGAALGVLALGGLALGGLALGGASLGLIAYGGMAVAKTYALGSQAMALHANDATAKEFFSKGPWRFLLDRQNWSYIMLLIWSPVMIFILSQLVRRSSKRQSK